jgi:hypothetical protein
LKIANFKLQMDSGGSTAGWLPRRAAWIARWSEGLLLVLLPAAAVLIGWRRLAGALTSPLSPFVLFVLGVILAAGAVVARLNSFVPRLESTAKLKQQIKHPFLTRERKAILPTLLISMATLVLAASLSLPGTSAGGLAVFWAVILAEETAGWLLLRPKLKQGTRSDRNHIAPQPVRLDPPEAPSPHHPVPVLAEEGPSEEVLQQLTRSQAADGSELLAGWLRMPFSPGQRTGSIHVAFCPPFAETPEVMVEQTDGPETRIKTAQLLPYGARLDLKLHSAAEHPVSVLMQFSARTAGF